MLAGCSIFQQRSSGAYYEDDGPPRWGPDPASIPNPKPRAEPLSKTGNSPYEVFGVRYVPMPSVPTGYVEIGEASWYGRKFHGRTTSSGEEYDMFQMTAAHKTLPLPTYLKVQNLNNKREVVVRVNDRGPFLGGRILDLSYVAAQKLGVVETGTAPVRISLIGPTYKSGSGSAKSLADIFLQAGSFRLHENAQRLRLELIQAGVTDVRILSVKVDQSLYYRVQAGPYRDPKQVQEKMIRVRQVTGSQPKMVVMK